MTVRLAGMRAGCADLRLLDEGLDESWGREMKERMPTPAIVGIRCYELAVGH